MKQSPSWEANSHSASQEILHLLWNLKVHYCVHNSLPLFPILSQMHSVHTLPPYFPKIYFTIILPSTPRSSKWTVPFKFSYQIFVCISGLFHVCYIPYASHPWFDHTQIIFGEASHYAVFTPFRFHFILVALHKMRTCTYLHHEIILGAWHLSKYSPLKLMEMNCQLHTHKAYIPKEKGFQYPLVGSRGILVTWYNREITRHNNWIAWY